jgi:ATP-binding cassette subfamily C protein
MPDAAIPTGDFSAFEATLLAKLSGERRAVGANNPFLATSADRVWLILRGRLDISLVPLRDGAVAGVGVHLLSLDHGQVLFGMPPVPAQQDGLTLGLRVVAAMDSELFEAPRTDLESAAFDLIAVDWIDEWVERLSATLVQDRPMPAHSPIEADPDQPMTPAQALTAPLGAVIWVRIDSGKARLLGDAEAWRGPGDPPLPLTSRSWLAPEHEGLVTGFLTPTALARRLLWPALDAFHVSALVMLRASGARRLDKRLGDAGRRSVMERLSFGNAVRRIGAVLEPRAAALPPATSADQAISAALVVAAHAGFHLMPPRDGAGVDDMLNRAGLRWRDVTLTGRWWETEPGALLATLAATGNAAAQPVALLPDGPGRMLLHHPATGLRQRLDAGLAAQLEARATTLYRPLPNHSLTARNLLRFSCLGLGSDFRRLVTMGACGGLLAILAPLAVSHLFGAVLPIGDTGNAVALVIGLVLAALGSAVFEAVRGIAILRMESHVDGTLQAAIWDRVLRMPPGFFRRYSVGDLTDRANSISAMRELLTATATQALLGAIFSVFSLALLFYFSWKLALLALFLTLLLGLVTWQLTRLQIPELQAKLDAQGRVEGLVLQLLAGIAKLRSAGAERRGFTRWAEAFSTQQHHTWRARRWQNWQQVVNQVFPPLTAIVLFWMAAPTAAPGLITASDFGGFHMAFGQFSAAVLGLAVAMGPLAALGPLYARIGPVLKGEPEITTGGSNPGTLLGGIELRHVTFRYAPDAPPVLDDISIAIGPGEFLAIVGGSGSGKSTLIRLLMGFERPESGGIAFDGRDQSRMDLVALRRQIGVVLQDGRLMSGSLQDNILGGSGLDQDVAWAAVRLAGLEADVRAMPMGLQTVVSEGTSTLSGGQRQRLLIARALARSPRILIFDEATSALDNRTQAVVNESLERLHVTRIVVAHRLSTIVNAHRIIVLDRGKIAESGTFKALMSAGGHFAAMAKRQML